MAAAAPLAGTQFAGWHLPLPAGEWLISRGPCGSGAAYSHPCGYYEDACALDLTPTADSMLNVPVLAPAAGQVFFLGTRSDSGLMIMLQHADGQLSALMHLSRVVVGLDQHVTQGQVVGYAGNSGSSTRPHLHFHVQPNAVERTCLPVLNIDSIDARHMTVQSRNLAWSELTLVDPPADLPAWLPLVGETANPAPGAGLLAPQRLVLAPSAQITLPVGIARSLLADYLIFFNGARLLPQREGKTFAAVSLPLTAPATLGEAQRQVQLRPAAAGGSSRWLSLQVAVRQPPDTAPSRSIVLINPTFVSPRNWAQLAAPPRLCWQLPAAAGPVPLLYRVMLAGPTPADSGWVADTCWQAPTLTSGTYAWKVFVRDGNGFMNRPNQRPYMFSVR